MIEVTVLAKETMILFGDSANDLHRVFYNNLKIMQPAIHCLQWSFGVTYWEVFSLVHPHQVSEQQREAAWIAQPTQPALKRCELN